jgi:hypothetical protein
MGRCKVALFDFTPAKCNPFEIHVGEIAVMQQAIFKCNGEKSFFAFKEFCADDFAIEPFHIMKTAAVQLNHAEIAIHKSTGTKSCVPKDSLGKVTTLERAFAEHLIFQGLLGVILGFNKLLFHASTSLRLTTD